MQTDFAVVGAGPAGIAAALTAANLGIDVTVIDEQRTPGGQVYRQPPPEFKVSDWLKAKAYRKGKKLLAEADAQAGIRWMAGSSVTGLFKPECESGHYRLIIAGSDGVLELKARGLLLAPGCFDMPVAFPGWNLPGVMSAGGIQVFVKSQQFVPGNEICFAGSHPLQLLIADQIVQAGGNVKEVLFLQRPTDAARLLRSPSLVFTHFGKLQQAGAALLRLRKAGVKVDFGHAIVRAEGEDQLENIVVCAVDRNGLLRSRQHREILCDRVGICYGFIASSELARQVGADCQWDGARGGWIVRHDEWMRSRLAGLFVAGEITGIGGADVAEEEGRLAAVGWALRSGKLSRVDARAAAAAPRRNLAQLRQFAQVLSNISAPGEQFFGQLLDDGVTLCKCEEVTVGAFKAAMRANPHVHTASAAKLLTRTGMGLCQGRYCQHMVHRLLSQSSPEGDAVGGFNARFPAKPIRIDQLIGDPEDCSRQD